MLKLTVVRSRSTCACCKLADLGRRDVVAAHLDRGLDLGVEIDDLSRRFSLLLREQTLGGHHLGDGIIKLGHAVAHVPDRLLQHQFRIFDLIQSAPVLALKILLSLCQSPIFICVS